MKRLMGMLAGASLLVLAGNLAANADTITGSWTSSLSAATSAHTSLTGDSLSNGTGSFSVSTTPIASGTDKGDQPDAAFVTVNPGSCSGTGCSDATATVTVTFGQIKDGSTVLSNGFTITGTFSADYKSNPQTDALVWTGASIADTGLPGGFSYIPMQDGNTPAGLEFAFADGAKTIDLFVLDGADWSVQTDIAAGITPLAVPGPVVGAGLPGIVAAFGLGLGWLKRRRGLVAA
jgi:hypothetical protein